MALDNVLKIYDEQGNPVDYDILASDVKFQNGKDLPTRLDELEQEIGEGGYAPPAGGIPKTDLATAVQESLNLADSSLQPSDKTQLQGAITQLQNALNTLIGSGNVQGAIDTFNEVVAFLNGINSSDTLAAKLAQIATDIATKANDNAVVKTISVNGGQAQTPTQGNVNINVQGVKGDDGITPHIGSNGHWFIGETDTGKPSQGETGNIVATDGVVTFEVVNNLTSTAPNKGLSAKMGNELLKLIQQIYTSLGAAAFWGTKPEIDWESVGFTMYNISRTLSAHAHAGSAATKVTEGDSYTEEITFDEGYAAQAIVVTMGGVNISSTAVNGNTITIAEVTGPISITVTETAMIPVTYNGLVNCSLDNSQGAQPTMVAPGGTLTFKLKANNGYELPANVTYGTSGTASISNGTVTIQNVTEAIDISATATAITTFTESGLNYVIDTNNTNRVYTTIKSGTLAQANANSGDKYTGDITIPASVSHDGASYNVFRIGNFTFCNCSGVTSITIEGGLEFGRHAFNGCGASSFSFGNGTYGFYFGGETTSYAFNSMANLERLILPDGLSVTSGLQATVGSCGKLEYLKLGSGYKRVGGYNFTNFKQGCTIDLGGVAAANCWKNSSDNNKPYFDGNTFDGKVGKLVIRDTTAVICNNGKLSSTNCTVYVPDNLVSSYQAESTWSGFTINGLSGYVEPSA